MTVFYIFPEMFRWPLIILCWFVGAYLTLGSGIRLWQIKQEEREWKSFPGCRKLGLPSGCSNLDDRFSVRHRKENSPSQENFDDSSICRVKGLFTYPIKSCLGIELDRSDIELTGFAYNRFFSFAQLISSVPKQQPDGSEKVHHEWKIITQREYPPLALVKTDLWIPDPTSPTHDPEGEHVRNGGCIIVSFPFTPDLSMGRDGLKALFSTLAAKVTNMSFSAKPTISFTVPFNPTSEWINKQKLSSENMTIWKDAPESLNMGPAIDPDALAKLKCFLGVPNPFTLFRVGNYREVYRCAPRKEELGFQPVVGFVDAYPLHILNLASVQDLSLRLPANLKARLDPRRFRANIYVSGLPPYAEDNWKLIRIGSSQYHVSCRTARCILPNVDPSTGIKDANQPLATLRSYRQIDEGAKPHACLGMQMTPMSAERGEIKVGDEVEVLETGEHWYIKQGS